MDGSFALPDEKTQKRAHGDEPACSGVQSPANDQHYGGRATDGGDTGLRVRLALFCCCYRVSSSVIWERENNVTGSHRRYRAADIATEGSDSRHIERFLRSVSRKLVITQPRLETDVSICHLIQVMFKEAETKLTPKLG